MEFTKKSLIISAITIFVCLTVAIVCLLVTKFSTWSIILSSVIVGLSIFSSVTAWFLARKSKA